MKQLISIYVSELGFVMVRTYNPETKTFTTYNVTDLKLLNIEYKDHIKIYK